MVLISSFTTLLKPLTMLMKDWFADIGAYINDEEIGIADYESTVDKGAWDEANSFSDGKMHIFPLITSGPVFFYNADIYNELGLSAPTTWAELEENSRAIKSLS